MFERLISASEVARRGGWHNVTVYQWAKDGRIPGLVRFGRNVRFKESEINRWLQAGHPDSTRLSQGGIGQD